MNKKKPKKRTASAEHNSTGSPMDISLLERIVRLMSANDLTAVEVRDGEKRVSLKRGADVVVSSASPGGFAVPQVAPAMQAPSPGIASGATTGASDSDAGLTPIKSPMVGTFYSAPSPDAKPFVSVGSKVDEETDVCVIEAMKVFNNIKAECKGTIARALVNNGETVEFGQTLFLVKP